MSTGRNRPTQQVGAEAGHTDRCGPGQPDGCRRQEDTGIGSGTVPPALIQYPDRGPRCCDHEPGPQGNEQVTATGDHQGEDRHNQQSEPDPAQTEVAGVQAEHLHRSDAVDRPVDRVQQRPDGPTTDDLEHEGEVEEAGHGDTCRGDHHEPTQAGEAPRQDRAYDQAHQDHEYRHGEHRVHRRNRSQEEPGDQHL